MKAAMITALLVLPFLMTLAQEKVEREWRVKTGEVPSPALLWFKDAYDLRGKVRWYREENESGTFYEAKLRHRGQRHSVKFTDQGAVYDVEIEVHIEALNEAVGKRLLAVLDSLSPAHRILKLQEQWTGEADNLKDLIDEKEQEGLTLRYEMEVFFRNGDSEGYHELLFSKDGSLYVKRPMRVNTTDHLQY
jgi:hypothetical protein